MNRLSIFLCLVAMVTFLPACGKDPQVARVYQVGIVSLNQNAFNVIKGFKIGMEKKGYIEGQNITYLYPGPLETLQQAKKMTRELVAKKVDLIYTITTPATKAAKKIIAGKKIPLLFGPMMSPISAGLASDLYSPENTLTGVRVRGSTEKALYYLLEIKPDLQSIYVPFHSDNVPSKIGMADLKKSAEKFGVEIFSDDLRNAEELIAALKKIPVEAEAIWLGNSHMLVGKIMAIVEAGNRQNIPVVSPLDQSNKGVLLTYAPKHVRIGEQISRLADKLLRGVKTSSLPIETADFFLGLNAKTAKALDIDIPQHILNQADFVVR